MLGVVGRWRRIPIGLHVVAVEGEVILVSRLKLHSLPSSHKPLSSVSLRSSNRSISRAYSMVWKRLQPVLHSAFGVVICCCESHEEHNEYACDHCPFDGFLYTISCKPFATNA
jgi:hypothetical protein